jgi:ABC-type transport system involved in cytochrome bd biosynthesis fused ATPase/permease subunit
MSPSRPQSSVHSPRKPSLTRTRTQGRTCITVAHRLSTIKDCDRIIVMDDGLVVEEGSHGELLALPHGKYKAMWALQQAEQAKQQATSTAAAVGKGL